MCTYYAAQCSVAGSRGQSLHLDYPYVSYSRPGDKYQSGWDLKNIVINCGILTFLNSPIKDNNGPIVLTGSQKNIVDFLTVQELKNL